LQKPQSPTIGWSLPLQASGVALLYSHIGFLAIPPRIGRARCRVESWAMLLSESVEAESRCLPAKTRRRSEVGRLVRRARRDLRVDMEVVDGIVRGMMFPAMFLTKIWTVSSASEVVEESEEMLFERVD